MSATGIAGALGAGAAISAVLVEEAPDEPPPAPVRSSRRGPGPDGGAERPRDADRGALVPARPALEIQLPYKDYKVRHPSSCDSTQRDYHSTYALLMPRARRVMCAVPAPPPEGLSDATTNDACRPLRWSARTGGPWSG